MSDLLRKLIAGKLPSTEMVLGREERKDYYPDEPKEPEPVQQPVQQPQMEYQGPVMLLPAGPPQMGPDGRLYAQRQRGIPLTGMAMPGAGHGFFERKKR